MPPMPLPLFLLPPLSGPRVFLRRAEAAASLSDAFPPPPLPPPLLLFPLPLRREAAAPLLSAAWKDVRRTLRPSGGPASTHEDEDEDEGEGEEEEEGEEVDAEVEVAASLLLESPPLLPPPAAEGDASPSAPFLPLGCLCCGVAGQADLRRDGAPFARCG